MALKFSNHEDDSIGPLQMLMTKLRDITAERDAFADDLETQRDQHSAELAEERSKLHSEQERHKRDLAEVKARAVAPFTRKDLEGMSSAQLLSLVEEGINACRRRSMLEAEGLVEKHRELTRETDLEMLRGLVSSYQARITAIELDQKKRQEQKSASVKLDTRTLAEKLAPQTASRADRALALWWGTPTTTPDQSFRQFDARATEVAKVVAEKPQPSCYCGVLLIRGQCQMHTRAWRGDERCECGRRFDFCKAEQVEGRAMRGVKHMPRITSADVLHAATGLPINDR